MQGTTANQMKMLLTRIGQGSKMIITGDLNQTDKQFHPTNGLQDFLQRVESYTPKSIGLVHFSNRDVQRHPVIKDVLRLYGEESE
jgi:phosphate starvation-inducible PhoH-like protein